MKDRKNYIDIEIDKLTNSIENITTGDSFPTEISLLSRVELRAIINKKWMFDWDYEFKQPDRDVYKLTIINNSNIIQGLVSLAVKEDHVYMHLIENAQFNKGETKVYAGVAGNLIAFACKLSFQRGCEGYVSFVAKTKLIEHYTQMLEAKHICNGLMIIQPDAALRLIDKYFKK